MLAEKYRFAIIEDDYDYDFHYARNPILPIASSDQTGNVIYVGSLSKTVAPGLRLGFVVAPENVIREIANFSRFIDCHGNTAQERAIALLFQERVIHRHLKKAMKTYHMRRDKFCQLLKRELGAYVSFRVPQGGLAVWVQFNERFPVQQLYAAARSHGLLISDTVFDDQEGHPGKCNSNGICFVKRRRIGSRCSIAQKDLRGVDGRCELNSLNSMGLKSKHLFQIQRCL